MDDYSRLEKSVQTAVKAAMDKFAEHTQAGLHLEKLQHPKDDRIRTIRIDIHWRGVVLAPDNGDTYYLLKVMEHDKAYAYAGSRKFTVNQALGEHVIVDEAHDLHPAQWRLLRSLVRNGPDDLFVVGDPHQRIYDNHVSLAKLAINVRGRSRRLTVSYRTTQEILAVAVPTLGQGSFAGLDDSPDTLDGYRSPLHGRRPKVIPASTREAERAALVRQVRSWLDDGIEPHVIGVAARAGYLWKGASAACCSSPAPAPGTTCTCPTRAAQARSWASRRDYPVQPSFRFAKLS